MPFDPKKFIEGQKQSRGLYKNQAVEEEYGKVNPYLRNTYDSILSNPVVTSGYRSPEENQRVGGVATSKHMTGDAVDFKKGSVSEEEKQRLRASGIKVLDEPDHVHTEGTPPAFDIKSFINENTSSEPIGPVYTPPQIQQEETGSLDVVADKLGLNEYQASPLSMIDRLKTSFGNPEGIQEYLRSKGYSEEDIQSSRPDTNKGLFALTPPALAGRISKGQGPNVGAMATTVRDIPGAIADIPATVLNMVPFGGTKAKQGIGEMLGTYKDQGQGYFNDEVVQNALIDLATLGMPAAGKALTGLETKAAQALGTAPEKMYARNAAIPELLDRTEKEIVTGGTPRGIEKIQSLLRKDYPTGKESLLKAASADKAIIGAEKGARLAQIGDIPTEPLINESAYIAANKLPIGKKETGRREIKKMMSELLPPQFTMLEGGKTIKGPQAKTIPASILEREKSLLDKTHASDAEAKIARNEMADLFRNTVRTADEPLAYQTGRSIKDINTEYHPLSLLTENLTDQINKSTQGGAKATNFKQLFSNLVLPARERIGRRVGQSLFNYKDVNSAVDPMSFSEAASDVIPAYLTKDIILQYLNQLKR